MNKNPSAISRISGILLKPAVFLLCLLPIATSLIAVSNNQLGANPVEAILQSSGEWALRLLLVTLAMTPLQFQFSWRWPARLRRMLGLFAFFYAVLHLLIWFALDQGSDLSAALNEVIVKPFVLAGMVTLLAMIPLAVTSNRFSVRKLGRRWKSLHALVYLLSISAMLHFVWQVKGQDYAEQIWYLGFLMVLLMWRCFRMVRN